MTHYNYGCYPPAIPAPIPPPIPPPVVVARRDYCCNKSNRCKSPCSSSKCGPCGPKGDTGPQGPQGPAGVVLDNNTKARTTVATTITAGTPVTFTFPTEVYDTMNGFTPGNNYITAIKAGKYIVSGDVLFTVTTATTLGTATLDLIVNGQVVSSQSLVFSAADDYTGVGSLGLNVSDGNMINNGQQVQLRITSTGVNLSVSRAELDVHLNALP